LAIGLNGNGLSAKEVIEEKQAKFSRFMGDV